MLAILLIPGALTYTFGRSVGDTRQGWAVLAAMVILLVPLVGLAEYNEQAGNPLIAHLGVDQGASALQSGGNMEGKETALASAPRPCSPPWPPRRPRAQWIQYTTPSRRWAVSRRCS